MCAVGIYFGTAAFVIYDLGAIAIAWFGMAKLISLDEMDAASKEAAQGRRRTIWYDYDSEQLAGDVAAHESGSTPDRPKSRDERTSSTTADTADAVHKQASSSDSTILTSLMQKPMQIRDRNGQTEIVWYDVSPEKGDEYRLSRELGRGGFGVTYLGHRPSLGSVAIKEYFPNEWAVRDGSVVRPKSIGDREDFEWGLDKFLNEARTLERFTHRNIVRVRDFFKANNTAYIVMDYEDGLPLNVLLERRGTLTETQLLRVLRPVVDGLRQVHAAGFLHRDIKPHNIFVRRSDESPVLLDFGSARQAVGLRSKSMTAIVSAGYSPPEQYHSGAHGAWTDIYALSALCYRAITGDAPIEAPRRQSQLLRMQTDPLPKLADAGREGYSLAFLEAVDWGLRVIETERPQDLEEWLSGWRIGEGSDATLRGDAEIQHNLGDQYYLGQGRPKDARQAAIWYRKAAEQGYARAQASLGLLYRRGEGVPKDAGQAVIWYREAADQGHANAQYNLGGLYLHGDGVVQDTGQAAIWYRKAAEQGHAKAQKKLSILSRGDSVPRDR